MKKKNKILLSSTFALLLVLTGVYLLTKDSPTENFTKTGLSIAMYIEDDSGDYISSTSNTFPTEGYVLNTQKSTCTNGGLLSQDKNTKNINLETDSQDFCTLFFDKDFIDIICDSSFVSNGTECINGFGSDGIPDMYQITVIYSVANGSSSFGSVVLTKYDSNGNPSSDGFATVTADKVPGTTPALGYTLDLGWDVYPVGQKLSMDAHFVYRYDLEGEDIEEPEIE